MNIKEINEQTQKLSLLYVEDENDIRNETSDFLKNFFLKMDVACDGKSGLELFEKNGYDLVISDLKMPKMGGEALLKRAKELNPATTTVAMSGISGGNGYAKLESDFFVIKPASMEALVEMLGNVIQMRQEQQ